MASACGFSAPCSVTASGTSFLRSDSSETSPPLLVLCSRLLVRFIGTVASGPCALMSRLYYATLPLTRNGVFHSIYSGAVNLEGQFRDSWRLEHLNKGNFNLESLADARDHLCHV